MTVVKMCAGPAALLQPCAVQWVYPNVISPNSGGNRFPGAAWDKEGPKHSNKPACPVVIRLQHRNNCNKQFIRSSPQDLVQLPHLKSTKQTRWSGWSPERKAPWHCSLHNFYPSLSCSVSWFCSNSPPLEWGRGPLDYIPGCPGGELQTSFKGIVCSYNAFPFTPARPSPGCPWCSGHLWDFQQLCFSFKWMETCPKSMSK